MDKRKEKNSSWDNLRKGPMVKKQLALENQLYNTCLNCGVKIKVYPSTRERTKFCNQACKNKGQSKGLTAPMRKGTGDDVVAKTLKGKYYKYRNKDGVLDYSVSEFVARIYNGHCVYCGSTDHQTLGLDRIDNNKPHLLNNTNVCCELCNTTRGHRFDVEQMKKIGKLIKTFDMNGWRVMNKKSLLKMKETVNNKL